MLKKKVAVVTGATRGAGKGVALALGDAGATVYVTGRSSRSKPAVSAPLMGTGGAAPGTVEETAEEVTRRGGLGIPVVVDHSAESQVKQLFKRVSREQQGRLDLLVNAAWGGNELEIEMAKPFWELPAQHWENMFTSGVKAAVLSSCQAAPLMVAQGSGLIINVTAWDDDKYTQHLYYDLAKATLNRLAFGMSQELAHHKVAAVALAPGWMRTERVLAAFGCTATMQEIYGPFETFQKDATGSTSSSTAPWTSCSERNSEPEETAGLRAAAASAAAEVAAPASAEGAEPTLKPQIRSHQEPTEKPAATDPKHWTDVPDLSVTESPLYLGRAVVALTADPNAALRFSQAGKVLRVADLARQFGFTDVDGRQPERKYRQVFGGAMGTNCMPPAAQLYLARKWETKAKVLWAERYPGKPFPNMFRRFINDNFVVFEGPSKNFLPLLTC